MTEFVNSAVRDHTLIVAWLGLFLFLAVFHGILDVCRIFMRCLIVIVQEVKHQFSGLRDVLRDLLKELRSWKSDP